MPRRQQQEGGSKEKSDSIIEDNKENLRRQAVKE
jgi:hypothetical protein